MLTEYTNTGHVCQWVHLFHEDDDSRTDVKDFQQTTKLKHNIFFTAEQMEEVHERQGVAGEKN